MVIVDYPTAGVGLYVFPTIARCASLQAHFLIRMGSTDENKKAVIANPL